MSETVTNWSGSLSFTPARRVEVENEDELVHCVRDARERGEAVRPIGSGHSSTPVFATDGVLVSLDRMSGLVDHHSEGATLLPGTGLAKAGELLADADIAMENLGDVDYQTIAGAIGTGTHGTGITLGNLSSTLVGGTLVTGSGDVVPFGSDAGKGEDDELLRAAQVSLGTLGIMSKLTIRALPVYTLHRLNWMSHIDWTMENFSALVADNRHFDFYWYPRSDRAQVRTMNLPDDLPTITPPNDHLKTEERDLGHQIITNDRDLRFDEMEYMFPVEQGMEIFAKVRERVKARHRQNVGWRVLVRTVRADSAMLSNCQGRDTMTIALLQNNELDHDDYFSDMEPLLLEMGGRPHWGKKHSLTAEKLEPMYPDWQAFQSIRRRLDPEGVLMNDYLRRLLGDDEGSGS